MSSIKNIASFNQGIKLQKKIREAKDNSEVSRAKDGKAISKSTAKDSIAISSASTNLQSSKVELARYVGIVKNAPGLSQKEVEEIETNIQSDRYLQPDVTEEVAEKVVKMTAYPETIAGFKDLGESERNRTAVSADRISDLQAKVANNAYSTEKFATELATKMIENGLI